MSGLSRAIVIGMIGKKGVEVRYATTGTPCASFTLIVTERGGDGKPHDTYIPCECWGKKAEAAGEFESGQLALFEGKLAKRRRGEQWELIVAGFELTPMSLAVAPTGGHSH
jgi:single-stranded DNA-binding protein